MHKNAFLQDDKANLGGPVSKTPSPTTLYKDNSAPSQELALHTGTENIFLPSPKANRYVLKAPGLDVKRHKQMCAYGV